jgi:site-specific DNA recombinase
LNVTRVVTPLKWQTVDVPRLRIVDQALFEQVAKRIETIGGTNAKHAPRSKRVLSGLLKCGCCSGGMTIIGSDRSGPRIQCSVHRESGACNNNARYYVGKIERLVIDALRIQLANPDLIKEYVKAYREERNRAKERPENSVRALRGTKPKRGLKSKGW